MTGFAEIRFKGTRKEYFAYEGLDLRPGQQVIVEADRGEDIGEVSAIGAIAERKCSSSSGGCATPAPERRVLRFARNDEASRVQTLRSDEDRVRSEARALVAKHELKMKVTEAEWQFDRNKLIIYFTAEKRVDFRHRYPVYHRRRQSARDVRGGDGFPDGTPGRGGNRRRHP